MTTLREAAQKALDAFDRSHALKLKPLHLAERMDALRAALAEPAPEAQPVAWIQPDHLNKARAAPFLCRVEPTQRLADLVPIYTCPAPRCRARDSRSAS